MDGMSLNKGNHFFPNLNLFFLFKGNAPMLLLVKCGIAHVYNLFYLIIVGAVGTWPVNPPNCVKTAPVFYFACLMFPSPPVSLGWRRVQRRDGWNASRADGPWKGPAEERPAALEGQGHPMAAGVHLRDRLLQRAVWHLCGNDAGAFLNTHL